MTAEKAGMETAAVRVVEPDANKGCRAFIGTAAGFWIAIDVWLWFAMQCPPVDDEWRDCDTPTIAGWIFLVLLAALVALVLTTIAFAGIRLLSPLSEGKN